MSEQKFPKRVWIDPKQFGSFNLIHAYEKTDMVDDIEYLSLEEHQHILAEKEKRIEKLREALKKIDHYQNGVPGTYSDPVVIARAALQEETK